MKEKFYITTTLPYTNSDPHIGFALEIVQADVIARYKRSRGYDVFFNTGTDEHGLKIFQKSESMNLTPKELCDRYAAKFKSLKEVLNLSFNNFIRTTDESHIKGAREFWQRSMANGDIYKKKYKAKYCVGCELFKTDSELEQGRCPLHPNREPEIIEEENYFFRFSKYQERLLDLYQTNPDFVVPQKRLNEIKSFVEQGLEDFSASRIKERMPWGIPVPGDEDQVLYVWYDALTNYVNALGWPDDEEKFKSFWPGVQVAGKDNLRQQTAIWQAMLMSAGLPNSKQVLIHGFITAEGQKMSKSLGNVVDPIDLVQRYGSEPVRYFLLREFSPFEDGDFSYQRFEQRYNADLANGLGNFISRVLSMVEKYCEGVVPDINRDPESHPLRAGQDIYNWKRAWQDLDSNMENYHFNEALACIWKFISEADTYIEESKPWELFKNQDQERLNWVLYGLLDGLHQVTWQIYPFLPQTSRKIAKILSIEGLLREVPLNEESWTNIKSGVRLKKSEILFPRL